MPVLVSLFITIFLCSCWNQRRRVLQVSLRQSAETQEPGRVHCDEHRSYPREREEEIRRSGRRLKKGSLLVSHSMRLQRWNANVLKIVLPSSTHWPTVGWSNLASWEWVTTMGRIAGHIWVTCSNQEIPSLGKSIPLLSLFLAMLVWCDMNKIHDYSKPTTYTHV